MSARNDQPRDDGPRCVVCGCTDERACPGGCWWVDNGSLADVCSACAGAPLTELERDVALKVAAQWPLSAIAQQLGFRVAAVTRVLERCCAKLGVPSPDDITGEQVTSQAVPR